MPSSNLVEISRINPYGDHTFVLAVNPNGFEDGSPFFMFGSEFDVYQSMYGTAVERCGSYDEVRAQLEFEAGFDDDFAPVAADFLAALDEWVANNC